MTAKRFRVPTERLPLSRARALRPSPPRMCSLPGLISGRYDLGGNLPASRQLRSSVHAGNRGWVTAPVWLGRQSCRRRVGRPLARQDNQPGRPLRTGRLEQDSAPPDDFCRINLGWAAFSPRKRSAKKERAKHRLSRLSRHAQPMTATEPRDQS